MHFSRCRIALAGALLTVVLALPTAATADVFDPLAPASIQSGPSVTTDKADYEPGSPVVLTGSGWQAGESVHIVVDDDGSQAPPWQHTADVEADASGGFVYQFDLPDVVVATYTVTSTGASSGTVTTVFTDSHVERGCGVTAVLTVNTTSDDFSATDDDICSLREAIVTSNAHPEVTDINLDADTYTLTIPKDASNDDGEDGDLDVSESVSINGAGKNDTVVEGGTTPGTGVDRVFHLRTPGTDLDLNDFTIARGFANTAGGGIRAEDGSMAEPNALDLTNMKLTENRLTGGNGGAGLYVVAFNIDTTVQNSDFIDNDTAVNCTGCDGGAIFNRGRSLDIDDSHLDMNSAGGKAGGLWNTNGGQVTIDDSTVNENTNNNAGTDDLDGFGGGIYQADEDSFMTITNSEVNGNTAQGRGGGIYITNGHLVLDRSEVNDNTLDGPRDGGGIFSSSALESPPAVQIIDTTVARNTTGRDGGGYFDNMNTNHDALLVKRSTFNNNHALGDGGGLRIRMDATIANSTISDNNAEVDGGGLWLIDKNVNLINDTISSNVAGGAGPGLRRDGGAPNDGDYFLSNTIVDDNDCSAEVNDNNPITAAFNNVTNNLDSGTSCGFGSANNSQSNATADLGPLQNNGGPTFTRAISTASDALDAGDDGTCAASPVDGIDQRHVTRPQGAHCDIGAYELAATIRGMKFEDLDPLGTKDVTDPGLEDWVINAYEDDGDGVLSPAEFAAGPAASGKTDSNGEYALGLSVNPVNDYVICEELQAGWSQTFPDPGSGDCSAGAGLGDEGYQEEDLAVGDDFDGRDFGNVHSAATVSGMKFRDVDGDGGDFDDAETPPDEPVEGWVIDAYEDDGDGIVDSTEDDTVAATATTAADGSYSLTLAAGDYVICETLPADWVQSFPNPGDGNCSGVDGHADEGYAVSVASGDAVTDKNFGNIAGLVKGKKTDESDNPLDGWVINAYADDGAGDGDAGDGELNDDEAIAAPVASATTAADGTYTIGLQDGDYVICEELQAGFTQVSPANDACTEVPDPEANGGHAVTGLTTDETFDDNDFVNTEEDETNTISGEKFRDVDSSGTNNAGDEPVQDWVINAFADDGDGVLTGSEATDPPAFTATTAADGTYSMDVDPGDYVVCEELKDDWEQSYPASGADCSVVDGAGGTGYAVSVPNAGDDSADNDFGNVAGLVSGLKFNDENEDHVNDADPDDPPLPNWVINAYADDGDGILDPTEAAADPVASETTRDPEGTYTIGLQAGDYVICEMLQTGWIQSFPNPGDGDCSNVDGAGAQGYFIDDLETTDHFVDKDFGNFEGATISGLKFDDQEDPKGTNAADPDDPGLEGFTIEAYADGGGGVATGSPIASDVTDADGNYTLTVPADTPPVDYVICEQLPTGWVQSFPDPGDGDCSGVSDATEGHTASVEVEDEVTGKDFGNYRTASVTVNKTYSDGTTTTPVTVKLECDSGDVDPATDTAAPGSPAEFDVEQFADGATCDVTEVSSVSGFTADTSDCQNLELEPGADLECTVENIESTTIVTNGGCTFDRVDDRAGHQFPAIFTPQTGGYYKLSSTNPGQFYLNVVYDGDQGDDIKITIPFPFVTVSPSAIDVHEDVTAGPNGSGRTCFHPKGSLLSKDDDQVTWNYGTGGQTFGATKDVHVTSPEDGLVYVRIHLAYGLKGVAGMCTKGTGTPPPADCTSPANHHFDGYEPYLFSFTGPNDSGGGTVESFNVFKKNPGIGTLALMSLSGDAILPTTVEYWMGTKKLGSQSTDEDGWSMWTYKYTGKATTFTVKLPAYRLSQNVTMKSNGYVSVSFAVPEGTTTPSPTPEPTPEPAPAPSPGKGGGKK